VEINDGNRFEPDEDALELAAIQAALDRWQQTANATPDAETGGLSPKTVHRLLHEPWGGDQAIIQFRTDLPPKDLEGAKSFRRASRLMQVISAADGVKVTPKGNLNRALVGELLVDPEMAAGEFREVCLRQKVVNEEDFFPLHVAKLVCRCAGLLRLSKGRLTVTSQGSRLLGEDRAGALFVRLFTASFRKFNLAYAYWRHLDAPALQSCAGYTLYRLGSEALAWRSPEALYPKVFLPAVRGELETELAGKAWTTPAKSAADRIFTPLLDLGLLEGRFEQRNRLSYLEAVRITPLFRHVLAFGDE